MRTGILLGLLVLVACPFAGRTADDSHRPSSGPAERYRLAADDGLRPSSRAVRAAAWHGGVTVAATGEPVRIEISDSYAPEAVSAQAWADFFGGLVHADELARLVVRIAPLAEVQQICGPDALGCYGGGVIAMPGRPCATSPRHDRSPRVRAPRGGERLNPPWSASDWGTSAGRRASRSAPASRRERRCPATRGWATP
jgi:hypothetical protein